MVEKIYDWIGGAILEEHSKRKHKILREYIFDYINVRCKRPQQNRFRLAIVEGFAGAGRYQCGAPGSPLIFIEELKHATESVNAHRNSQGLCAVEIEFLLICNDADRNAIEILKSNISPLQIEIAQTATKLHFRVEYLNGSFGESYPKIKDFLDKGRYRNVLFILDQYGHSHVEGTTILDIMQSYSAVEIFYTFAITSLIAFLQKSQPERLRAQLNHIGISDINFQALDSLSSRREWLGTAEKIVFDTFRLFAPYVSPFSINNPGGWRYWLIHFAKSYRARQVYNNILHDNATMQAHYGRSGLNMLSYDPRDHEGKLYLFDLDGRKSAKEQLLEDIPRLVAESGNAISIVEFYESIYNLTPTHADDIHAAIMENSDLQVITPAGRERRRANTIAVDDIIKLKIQRTFFPMFSDLDLKKNSR